jgi:hypothetical protein
MPPQIRIKQNILSRLRELHRIPSEEAQARWIGVDRATLRRIDAGASPSAAFIAGAIVAFDLPFEALFDVITSDRAAERVSA